MTTVISPPVASSKRIHTGNLYTWILLDTYTRALRSSGKDASFVVSWNIFSSKLEKIVREQTGISNKEEVSQECLRRTYEAIENAERIFSYYHINPSETINNNDPDLVEYVLERVRKFRRERKIDSSNQFELNPVEQLRPVFNQIEWNPSSAYFRLSGIKPKSHLLSINREGVFGVEENHRLLSQKLLNALLPDYIHNQRKDDQIFFCGSDLLAKYLYLYFNFSEDFPIKKVGVTGMILGKDGRKISKRDHHSSTVYEKEFDPDSARISLLKRSLGTDFRESEISNESRLLNKVKNCLIYFNYHCGNNPKSVIELSEFYETGTRCLNNLNRMEFSKAVQNFRDLIFEDISKGIIPAVRERGMNGHQKRGFLNKFNSLSSIFCPNLMNEFHQD